MCAGLDNAGKSTLLHKLCNQEVRAFVPTTKAHAKTFSLGSITFTAWDLGGHEQVHHCSDVPKRQSLMPICTSARAHVQTRAHSPTLKLKLTHSLTHSSNPRCEICGRSTIQEQTRSYLWLTAQTTIDSTRCAKTPST